MSMKKVEEMQMRRYGQEGTRGLEKVDERIARRVARNIAHHDTSLSVDHYEPSRGAFPKQGYLAYQSMLNESSRGKYVGLNIAPRPKRGVNRPYLKRWV